MDEHTLCPLELAHVMVNINCKITLFYTIREIKFRDQTKQFIYSFIYIFIYLFIQEHLVQRGSNLNRVLQKNRENNDTKSSTLKVRRHNTLKRFKKWPGAWNVVSPRTCFVLFILLPRTEHQRVYLSSFQFSKSNSWHIHLFKALYTFASFCCCSRVRKQMTEGFN